MLVRRSMKYDIGFEAFEQEMDIVPILELSDDGNNDGFFTDTGILEASEFPFYSQILFSPWPRR
jgi:hypothetical protein